MAYLPMFDDKHSSTRDKIIGVLAASPGLNTKVISNTLKKQYALNVTYQAIHKTLKQMVEEGILNFNGKEYNINPEWLNLLNSFVASMKKESEKKDAFASPTVFNPEGLKQEGSSATVKFRNLMELDNFLIDFENKWVKDEKNKDHLVVWQQWHNRFPIMYPEHKFKANREFEKQNIKHYILCRGNTPLDNWAVKFYKQKNIFVRNGMQCSESCETGIYGDIILELFYSNEVIKKIDETYSKVKRIEDLDLNTLFSEVLERQGDFYIHIQRNKTIAEQIKNRVLEQYLKEFEEIVDDLTQQKKKGKKILNFKSEYMYMTSRQIDSFLKTQTENEIMDENELILISRNIKRFLEPIQIRKNLSIFDLGTGDGSKADFILSNIQAFYPNLIFTYYAIDFSSQILDMSIDKVKMDHPFVNTIKINERIPEMENNNLLKKNMNSSSNNLILCLGNLFSNLDYDIFTQFFSRITRPSDLLVIGVEVRKNDEPDIKRILDKYSSPADKHFVMSAFEEIDIREPNLRHEVVFNKETKKIEVYIEILSLPQNLIKKVRDIGFKEGDKILMVSSWKPTLEEFRQQLARHFTLEIITNKDKTLAVAFCRIKLKQDSS